MTPRRDCTSQLFNSSTNVSGTRATSTSLLSAQQRLTAELRPRVPVHVDLARFLSLRSRSRSFAPRGFFFSFFFCITAVLAYLPHCVISSYNTRTRLKFQLHLHESDWSATLPRGCQPPALCQVHRDARTHSFKQALPLPSTLRPQSVCSGLVHQWHLRPVLHLLRRPNHPTQHVTNRVTLTHHSLHLPIFVQP